MKSAGSVSCIICLGPCRRNKICITCECHCHPSCYGEYLHSNLEVTTYVYSDHIELEYPGSTQCPQCRSVIYGISPLTRKASAHARQILVVKMYEKVMETVQLLSIIDEYHESIPEFLSMFGKKYILPCIQMIRSQPLLHLILLGTVLYYSEKKLWPNGDYIHYRLVHG